MKTLYMIGGPMGVGKTSVARVIKNKILNSVYLNADNLWDANPFTINDETRTLIIDNITHCLNNYIKSDAYEEIIFTWVLSKQEIIDAILDKLILDDCKILIITLTCSKNELTNRINKDIEKGLREKDVLKSALNKLEQNKTINSIRIDTTEKSIEDVADEIIALK